MACWIFSSTSSGTYSMRACSLRSGPLASSMIWKHCSMHAASRWSASGESGSGGHIMVRSPSAALKRQRWSSITQCVIASASHQPRQIAKVVSEMGSCSDAKAAQNSGSSSSRIGVRVWCGLDVGFAGVTRVGLGRSSSWSDRWFGLFMAAGCLPRHRRWPGTCAALGHRTGGVHGAQRISHIPPSESRGVGKGGRIKNRAS